MNEDFQRRLIYLILALPAYVLAFTLHEFAHAYVADQLGDDTPRKAGKFSLDPLKMLDPFGSLLLVVTLLMGLPLLGYAFVPITPSNFRHPARDQALVAVAGPLCNFAQALVWLAILFGVRIAATKTGFVFEQNFILGVINRTPTFGPPWEMLATVSGIGVVLNISLGFFNLLPIPPFDGGTIAQFLVPALRPFYDFVRPAAFFIIFLLINAGPVLYGVFKPVDNLAAASVLRAFGEDPHHYTRDDPYG